MHDYGLRTWIQVTLNDSALAKKFHLFYDYTFIVIEQMKATSQDIC